MLCDQAKSRIERDYLDKSDRTYSDELRQHLSACRSCRAYGVHLANILKTMQWEKMETPGGNLPAELIAAMKDNSGGKRRSSPCHGWFRYAAVCIIVLILAIGIAPFAMQKGKPVGNLATGKRNVPVLSTREKRNLLIFGEKNPLGEFLPFPEMENTKLSSFAAPKNAMDVALWDVPPKDASCPRDLNPVNFTARFKNPYWNTTVKDLNPETVLAADDSSPDIPDAVAIHPMRARHSAVTDAKRTKSSLASRGVVYSPDILDGLAVFSPVGVGRIQSSNLPPSGGNGLSGAIGKFTAVRGLGEFAAGGMGTLGGTSGGAPSWDDPEQPAGWSFPDTHALSSMMTEESGDFTSVQFNGDHIATDTTLSCLMTGS